MFGHYPFFKAFKYIFGYLISAQSKFDLFLNLFWKIVKKPQKHQNFHVFSLNFENVIKMWKITTKQKTIITSSKLQRWWFIVIGLGKTISDSINHPLNKNSEFEYIYDLQMKRNGKVFFGYVFFQRCFFEHHSHK